MKAVQKGLLVMVALVGLTMSIVTVVIIAIPATALCITFLLWRLGYDRTETACGIESDIYKMYRMR